MPQVVITAVGPDRPGLVDELTAFLLEVGANVADSSMVNLGGQFALIMLVQISKDRIATVQTDTSDVGRRIGLAVTVSADTLQTDNPITTSGMAYLLKVRAMDQPGIVHRITHLLHDHHVNIEELQTRRQPGSVAGTPLFNMELRMTVPPDVLPKTLRLELQQLCNSLNCDAELTTH